MDRIVRRKQLLELIGVSSTTQWRMEKAGQFPARVKIGKGLVGWHLVEVEKWLEGRERVLRCSQGSAPIGIASYQVAGNQPGIDGKAPLAIGQENATGSNGITNEN